MPPKQQTSTSDEEVYTHLLACNGGVHGSGCVALVLTWLPKRAPRRFMELCYIGGFYVAPELEALNKSTEFPQFQPKPEIFANFFNSGAIKQ